MCLTTFALVAPLGFVLFFLEVLLLSEPVNKFITLLTIIITIIKLKHPPQPLFS
ncbi:hypothetical protein LEQ41_07145 [Streptococcus agalactiae]|nr:hypothetical protein [Streptococcus agalactiae]